MEASYVELAFAALIVLVLVGLAVYYGPRQWRILRDVDRQDGLDAADRRYYRSQAWRRLVNSALMLLLAGLLVATYVMGQERQAMQFGEAKVLGAGQDDGTGPNADQKRFLNQYSATWFAIILTLLAILTLAFVDLWAIRRFGLRHYRQIQADRREVIRREVTRLRSQRNGH